nr:T9SS type A sorting domain-containing protein [Bacteroidota bacterium]
MKRIYIGFISILVCNFLYASTLLVPSQFATIQSAINASVVGDTVLVDAGATYIENINFMGKDIVVRTPNPATDKYTTFIDGNGGGSVALFISNETNAALLEGFTLKNGTGTLRSWWYYLGFDLIAGGGILCDSPSAFNQAANSAGSSPTLAHLIVENNIADFGGGIACWRTSRPIIKNTIVRNNTATGVGGGLSFFEGFNTIAGPANLMENVEVTNNNCTGGVGGGGIITNYSSKVVMVHCTVTQNTSTVAAGENLFRANGAFFVMHNSIIWTPNTDVLYDQGGTPVQSTIDYSCVANFNGPLTNVIGNITTNPDFINPGANDFHLMATSLCINAGNLVNSSPIDLDSNLRDAQPDMGAYEIVSVAPAPFANLQSSDTSFCDKNAIDFFDLSTNNPTSWFWTFAGASPSTSTLQNPTGIYYPSYGSFDVTLVACNANGCDTIFLPGFITEYPLPNPPVVSQSNDTLFSTPASTYQWFLIPNPIPGANGQFYVPTQPGSYYVLVSDSNGCEVPSNILVVTNTGFQNNNNGTQNTLNNIGDGIYQLNGSLFLKSDVKIIVTDVLGKIVFQSMNNSIGTEINLQHFAKGIYHANIICNKIAFTQRIVR